MSHSLINQLRDRYIIEENGCWIWCAGTSSGYARINMVGHHTLVHRAIYEDVYGKIPDGLEIDHTCKRRLCINPKHLEAVTPLENMCRAFTMSEARRQQIVDAIKLGHSYRRMNRELKVGVATITRLKRQLECAS